MEVVSFSYASFEARIEAKPGRNLSAALTYTDPLRGLRRRKTTGGTLEKQDSLTIFAATSSKDKDPICKKRKEWDTSDNRSGEDREKNTLSSLSRDTVLLPLFLSPPVGTTRSPRPLGSYWGERNRKGNVTCTYSLPIRRGSQTSSQSASCICA